MVLNDVNDVTNINWNEHFIYTNEVPSIAQFLGVAGVASFFVCGVIAILLMAKKQKLYKSLLLIPALGLTVGYLIYTDSLSSYEQLIKVAKVPENVTNIYGRWNLTNMKQGRYHSELVEVGDKRLSRIDPSRYIASEGCLAKTLNTLLFNINRKESLLKLSYVTFKGVGPKEIYNDPNSPNMDLICIIAVSTSNDL